MSPRMHPLALAVSGAFALTLFISPAAAFGIAAEVAAAPSGMSVNGSTRVRHAIVLREPALASYHGGKDRLAMPPRIASGARKGRLDVRSTAALGYVDYLAQQQASVVADIERQLGRPLPTMARLQHALNAVVVELTPAEATSIARRSDVAQVEADAILPLSGEPGPGFIGADTIWDGSASGGVATQGEGIVIGIIDSGINWQSPSFAAISPVDGYPHVNPLGAGQYLGGCAASAPNPDLGHCNDKLIGMYNLANSAASADDTLGHGSHTASTAAGNHRIARIGGGDFPIAGIAPRANLVMFSCFSNGGCSSIATLQSIDRAVADGVVDVLNYSVAGGTDPWGDAVSQAFLGATEAGLFVAASAGNDGPDPHSISHIEPWVTTVAASTLDYTTGFDFSLSLPGGAPPNTQHIGVHPGAAPTQTIASAPLVRSPGFDDLSSDGCAAFAPGTFDNAIAVLRMDTSTFTCGTTQRQTHAVAAGAVGVLFVDADTYVPVGASGAVWSMLLADWDNVWSAMQSDPVAASASIALPLAMYPDTGDHIADFSSRGPNVAADLAGQVLFKPDLSAPGVQILAAYTGSPDAVEFMDGTSMAAPHIAGAAALLRALHADWTPMEIKSALTTTAWTINIVNQYGGPVTPWARGAGRVDLTAAARAGLLLNESGANLRAADPAQGGDLLALNLPSAALGTCATDACTFTRRLRNPLEVSVEWSASVADLPSARVSPATFTLPPGATQDVSVSINPAILAGTWSFGELRLATEVAGISPVHLPIAVKRNGGAPLLLLSDFALSATVAGDATSTHALILSNPGTGAIHWSVDTSTSGCAQPAWASYGPISGTLLSGGAARTLNVGFDAHALVDGTYTAQLCIASDDPDMPLARVDLSLEVLTADAIFGNGFDG